IVLQLNFPENTRAVFLVVVRDDNKKELFSALVDTRNNDWKNILWIGFPVDENMKESDLPIPCEMDVVRQIQWKFQKFEPYWNHPSHRNQLLTRDEWLSAMALALMKKDAVKLK